jgi:hypothetical protein
MLRKSGVPSFYSLLSVVISVNTEPAGVVVRLLYSRVTRFESLTTDYVRGFPLYLQVKYVGSSY